MNRMGIIALVASMGVSGCAAESNGDGVLVDEDLPVGWAGSVSYKGCTLTPRKPYGTLLVSQILVYANADYSCNTNEFFDRDLRVWLRKDGTDLGGTENSKCVGAGQSPNGNFKSGGREVDPGTNYRSGAQIFLWNDTGSLCSSQTTLHSAAAYSDGVYSL